MRWVILYFLLAFTIFLTTGKKNEEKDDQEEKWKKKDVRDYSDADMERLFDQWEEQDEDELPEDEQPEWKREPPKVDMSKIDPSDPEGILKMSKKGRTLMMFATVSGNPTEKETETITQLWHSSLFNANIETQRFVVSENRVIFMLNDGSKAWEVKDFLVKQDRCEVVTIEGKDYPGKGAGKESPQDNKTKKSASSESKKEKKKSDNDIKKKDKKKTEKKEKDKKGKKDEL